LGGKGRRGGLKGGPGASGTPRAGRPQKASEGENFPIETECQFQKGGSRVDPMEHKGVEREGHQGPIRKREGQESHGRMSLLLIDLVVGGRCLHRETRAKVERGKHAPNPTGFNFKKKKEFKNRAQEKQAGVSCLNKGRSNTLLGPPNRKENLKGTGMLQGGGAKTF